MISKFSDNNMIIITLIMIMKILFSYSLWNHHDDKNKNKDTNKDNKNDNNDNKKFYSVGNDHVYGEWKLPG